jgi:DNA repair protein RadC
MQANSNDTIEYTVTPPAMRPRAPAEIVTQALAFLDAQMRTPGTLLSSPDLVKKYLALHNGQFEDQHIERFSVMWLDSQNRLIAVDTLFTGTLTQTSVYPREVLRAALKHNASSAVLCHNHPSGSVQPSRADEHLTQTIKAALILIDVRTLDHVITSGSKTASMAEMGLV